MKKTICLLLALILTLSVFAGCANTGTNTDPTDAPVTEKPSDNEQDNDPVVKETAKIAFISNEAIVTSVWM